MCTGAPSTYICAQEAPPPTCVQEAPPPTYVYRRPLHLHMCTGGPSTYMCAQKSPPPTYVQQKLNDLGFCCCVLQLCRQIRHYHITNLYCGPHCHLIQTCTQFLSLYLASKIETDNCSGIYKNQL